jgi:hypothetical protein
MTRFRDRWEERGKRSKIQMGRKRGRKERQTRSEEDGEIQRQIKR